MYPPYKPVPPCCYFRPTAQHCTRLYLIMISRWFPVLCIRKTLLQLWEKLIISLWNCQQCIHSPSSYLLHISDNHLTYRINLLQDHHHSPVTQATPTEHISSRIKVEESPSAQENLISDIRVEDPDYEYATVTASTPIISGPSSMTTLDPDANVWDTSE